MSAAPTPHTASAGRAFPDWTHHPAWLRYGAAVVLTLIAVWAVIVVALSAWVGTWPILVQAVFYLVAGIAWVWVLPLRPLLCWMETGRWRAPQ